MRRPITSKIFLASADVTRRSEHLNWSDEMQCFADEKRSLATGSVVPCANTSPASMKRSPHSGRNQARQQFAGGDLGISMRAPAWQPASPPRHQDLVQRAVQASSP